VRSQCSAWLCISHRACLFCLLLLRRLLQICSQDCSLLTFEMGMVTINTH
jgi:hypothetical protein